MSAVYNNLLYKSVDSKLLQLFKNTYILFLTDTGDTTNNCSTSPAKQKWEIIVHRIYKYEHYIE